MLTAAFSLMVRTERLELSHLSAPEPKSGASTNSATFAKNQAHKFSGICAPPQARPAVWAARGDYRGWLGCWGRWIVGNGTHKGCRYRTGCGTHKGCRYRTGCGTHKGCRATEPAVAPTRGAATGCRYRVPLHERRARFVEPASRAPESVSGRISGRLLKSSADNRNQTLRRP